MPDGWKTIRLRVENRCSGCGEVMSEGMVVNTTKSPDFGEDGRRIGEYRLFFHKGCPP